MKSYSPNDENNPTHNIKLNDNKSKSKGKSQNQKLKFKKLKDETIVNRLNLQPTKNKA